MLDLLNGQQPAASFKQPLDLLLSCHKKIAHFSTQLVTLSDYLLQNGWDEKAEQSAKQIVQYFDKAAPLHHQDEEESLFPALIKLDPTLQDNEIRGLVITVNALIKEHVQHDDLWLGIAKTLKRENENIEALKSQAEAFKQLLDAHIDVENGQIIPLARARLSEGALQEMGKAMAKRRGVPF